MAYAQALADWGDAGGYDAEVLLGHRDGRRARRPLRAAQVPRRCRRCPAASRSGSCWRRCCAAPTRCCCSTSPTTTSTCPASGGSSSGCGDPPKTMLFVSHDRELLAAVADRIVTIEGARHARGCTAAGSPPTTRRARRPHERMAEVRRRWDEEHAAAQGPRAHVQAAGGHDRRTWRRATGRAEPAGASSRRPGRRPSRRREQKVDDAAARRPHRRCGRSPASGSS